MQLNVHELKPPNDYSEILLRPAQHFFVPSRWCIELASSLDLSIVWSVIKLSSTFTALFFRDFKNRKSEFSFSMPFLVIPGKKFETFFVGQDASGRPTNFRKFMGKCWANGQQKTSSGSNFRPKNWTGALNFPWERPTFSWWSHWDVNDWNPNEPFKSFHWGISASSTN